MKTARKYDLETGQYEDYVLPEELHVMKMI